MKVFPFRFLTSVVWVLAFGPVFMTTLPLTAADAVGSATNSSLLLKGGFDSLFQSGALVGAGQGRAGFCLDPSTVRSNRPSLKGVAGPDAQTIKLGRVATDIDTLYTLTLWIKTQDVTKADGVAVKIFQGNDSTGWNAWYPTTPNDLPVDNKTVKTGGTHDWTEFTFSFQPDAAAEYVDISVSLDSGTTGAAWFSDVSLKSVSTRVAQRDFAGDWHNVRRWGNQVRWTDTAGATDHLALNLQEGSYHVWLSLLGEKHGDIAVAMDGHPLGTGDGGKPTGWQKLGDVSPSTGRHLFTLTPSDPKGFHNQAAYAGLVVSSDSDAPLPDLTPLFAGPLDQLPVTLAPSKPSDSRLVMVFSSYFTEVGFTQFGAVGFPRSGAARLAAVAHKHGIPVTWLIRNAGAIKMKDLLTKWHNENGDDVASFDWKDWGPLKAALPWASTTSAAASDLRSVDAFEDAGVHSAWGWCWEQAGIDGISDRGSPWAPFYASRQNYRAPVIDHPGKVLAFEWTMRDLNKSLHIHSGEACRFSTDPDEIRRGQIGYGRSIDYWKQLLDEYLRNTEWNDTVPFLMQQESHETEWSFPWNVNAGENKLEANWDAVNRDVQELDEFFEYAKSKHITFMTQPQFAEVYRKKYPETTPARYMLFRDIPTQEPVVYVSPGAPVKPGPYPLTFLYFDAECQLAFEAGERLPKMVYNYQRQAETNPVNSYADEAKTPTITSFVKTKSGEKEIWTITVTNPNSYAFPLGITEWGDFSRSASAEHSANVKEVKPIGTTLLFIRCTAAPAASTTFTLSF